MAHFNPLHPIMRQEIAISTHWKWREKRTDKECFSPMGTTRPRVSGHRLYSTPKYAAYMRHLFEQAVIYQYPQAADIKSIQVSFHFPMPKTWSLKKKKLMEGKPHQQKPDSDNCIKAVMDALWVDDEKIAEHTARKVWCDGDVGYVTIHIDA